MQPCFLYTCFCIFIHLIYVHVSSLSIVCLCVSFLACAWLLRGCGFAVVVISLFVGRTNLSIQFLPLVFSSMREPSLSPLLLLPQYLCLSQNTSFWKNHKDSPSFMHAFCFSDFLPFFYVLLLLHFSIMYICVSLHFIGLELCYASSIGAISKRVLLFIDKLFCDTHP